MTKAHQSRAIRALAPAAPAPANTRTIKGKAANTVVDMAQAKGAENNPMSKAQAAGQKALGSALATRLYQAVMAEGQTLRRFCGDILNLDVPGRAEFRKELNAKKREASNMDKAASTQLVRTAFVRISEAMTISKAADAGMKPDDVVKGWNDKGIGETRAWDDITYAFIVQFARFYLQSQATNGPTARRGRVAMSNVDKVKKFILSNIPPKELAKIEKMVHELAARVKTQPQAVAELNAMKAPNPAAKKAQKAEAAVGAAVH